MHSEHNHINQQEDIMSERFNRHQLPTRRTVLAGGLSMAGSGLLLGASASPAHAQGVIQMGSASLGSTGYVIIETLSAVINRFSDPPLRTSSMSTGGGAENMHLLGEGIIELGQTTSSDWAPALAGMPPYGRPIELNQMFSYMVWSPAPFVSADSDIQSLEDFAGRRFSAGSAGGSANALWTTIFETMGILDQIRFTHQGWRETYDAFQRGQIEGSVAILTVGQPSPLIQELEASTNIRLLPVPDELLDAAAELNPGVLKFRLTPDAWGTVPEEMSVPGYAGILGARKDVDAETGYNITRSIYDNYEFVQAQSNLTRYVEPEFATAYLMRRIPVNAGAAQYFKEIGVWRDELTIADH